MKRLEKEFTSKGVTYKELKEELIGGKKYRTYKRDGEVNNDKE